MSDEYALQIRGMIVEQKFFTIPTLIGRQKQLAHSLAETKLNVVEFAVGDGNGEYYKPEGTMTSLKNEKWRGSVTNIEILPESLNIVKFTTFIDGDIGGFTVREIAVFDDEGDMIAISNTPSIEKTGVVEGVPTGLTLNMQLIVEDSEVINLIVDTNIAGASKDDLERMKNQILAVINNHNNDELSHSYLIEHITTISESLLSYYTKAEVDAFLSDIERALSNKVNVGASISYPLPFAAGIENYASHRSCYSKARDESCLFISISCKKTDGSTFVKDDVIATLPVGFRPTEYNSQIILLDSNPTGNRSIAALSIYTNGNIIIQNATSDASLLQAHAVIGTLILPLQKSSTIIVQNNKLRCTIAQP